MRIVIDGDNFALIPTPHPKDKPTFILYLFATQLSGETGKEQSRLPPCLVEFSVVVVIGCHQPESRVLTHTLCVLLPIDWNLK